MEGKKGSFRPEASEPFDRVLPPLILCSFEIVIPSPAYGVINLETIRTPVHLKAQIADSERVSGKFFHFPIDESIHHHTKNCIGCRNALKI